MTEEISLDAKLRRLHKLAVEIEDAKSERDKKIGEKNGLMNTLRIQYGQNSVEEAWRRINNLDAQLVKKNAAIDKAFKHLAEQYEI